MYTTINASEKPTKQVTSFGSGSRATFMTESGTAQAFSTTDCLIDAHHTSTRPFLSNIDKKWIFFQILCALRDARNRKTSHGDIKTSNILVTSWNWVYASDFASFKPT